MGCRKESLGNGLWRFSHLSLLFHYCCCHLPSIPTLWSGERERKEDEMANMSVSEALEFKGGHFAILFLFV